MRIIKPFATTLTLLLCVASFAQVNQAPARSVADAPKAELNPEEFKRAIETGKYQLVDVRTPSEFASGHIAKASNIDWTASGYETAFTAIKHDTPVLLYCHSGGRSEQALEYLIGKGYRVQHLDGGISAWRKAGFPIVK